MFLESPRYLGSRLRNARRELTCSRFFLRMARRQNTLMDGALEQPPGGVKHSIRRRPYGACFRRCFRRFRKLQGLINTYVGYRFWARVPYGARRIWIVLLTQCSSSQWGSQGGPLRTQGTPLEDPGTAIGTQRTPWKPCGGPKGPMVPPRGLGGAFGDPWDPTGGPGAGDVLAPRISNL